MIRLKIRLKLRDGGVMRVCASEDKIAVVVVASYHSVSRNPVRFKAMCLRNNLQIAFIPVFKENLS